MKKSNTRLLTGLLIVLVGSALTHIHAAQSPKPGGQPAAAGDDCCSPAAEKKIADSLGFVDILGVKLGMTPEQAFAAIKASNPKLKIDIINARMEPGDAPGTFKRVPHWAVAHTVGVQKNPLSPVPFELGDGSADEIVMQFTTPPNPPLVALITRTVTFPVGQFVVVSTLIQALQKKYGQENVPRAGARYWVFDNTGKLLTRQLAQPENICLDAPYPGFPFQGGGQMPSASDVLADQGVINLANTTAEQTPAVSWPICRPLTIAMGFGLGQNTAPNQMMTNMVVAVESPALLHAAYKSTHDWLQSQLDAKNKQLDDAARQRSAPKL